jgi:methyl-accepting chemotaxis protein
VILGQLTSSARVVSIVVTLLYSNIAFAGAFIMKNLKIGTRLAAGFGLVLALMILMTVIGIRHMQSVATATRDMMQQPLAKERMISDWYRLIHTSVRRTSAISKSSDPSLGPFFAEETASSTAEVNGLQKKVEPLLESDEEKAIFTT